MKHAFIYKNKDDVKLQSLFSMVKLKRKENGFVELEQFKSYDLKNGDELKIGRTRVSIKISYNNDAENLNEITRYSEKSGLSVKSISNYSSINNKLTETNPKLKTNLKTQKILNEINTMRFDNRNIIVTKMAGKSGYKPQHRFSKSNFCYIEDNDEDEYDISMMDKIRKKKNKKFLKIFVDQNIRSYDILKFIESFEGQVVDEVSEADIHLLKKMHFMPNVLASVCKGIPIVDTEFVYETKRCGKFPENPIDLVVGSPSLRKMIEGCSKKKFFDNISVFLCPKIRPNSNDIEEICRSAGGEIFRFTGKTLPKQTREHVIFIYNPNENYDLTMLLKRYKNSVKIIDILFYHMIIHYLQLIIDNSENI